MNAQPTVSVIVPAYNHERYVAAAIESVLTQTFQDFELVIVDDASQDRTWEIASAFADHRIRTVRHHTNLGAHATLNDAVSETRGAYIAVLNSDDAFHPRRLETLVEGVRQVHDEEAFAFTDVAFVDADGTSVPGHPRALDYDRLRELCMRQVPLLWFLSGNLAISTSNFFFSRGLFSKIGRFAPLRYTHDWDWALRTTTHCTPVWIREALLSYRVHDANTLSEDDVWRHVHENSYVQASALMRLRAHPQHGVDGASFARDMSIALLRNPSVHPVALLCFLTWYLAGSDESAVREHAIAPDGTWSMQSIAEEAGYPQGLFLSAPHLIELDNVIASQAALIDERWNAMQHMGEEVADRDRWIASQAALIDERWNAMQHMGEEIADRDRWIADLQERLKEVDVLRFHLAAAEKELEVLYGSRLIRATLFIRRQFRKLGILRSNPHLRGD